MKMATCETQQVLPTFLLMTSTYPCKVLVVIHNVSMQILKYTTESFMTWLEKAFLAVINMKKMGMCTRDIIISLYIQNP